MSLKIKVSFEDDSELENVLQLLKPIVGRFKVVKPDTKTTFKRAYICSKENIEMPKSPDMTKN